MTMGYLHKSDPREEPKKYICVWKVGSSNKFTGKSEQPISCQAIGCPGEFKNLPPMLEGKILTCFLSKD
jgi:hypothetical protein